MLSSTAERRGAQRGARIAATAGDVGLDIHALAERIEHGGEAPLSAAEMQRIYDAAYQDGLCQRRRTWPPQRGAAAAQPIGVFAASVDNGVNGYSWQEIAAALRANKHSVPRQGARIRREHPRASWPLVRQSDAEAGEVAARSVHAQVRREDRMMRPILEMRLAMIVHGYTPIPVAGKKPPLEAWQKITTVSRAMLEEWDRNWPHASNTGVLTRLTPTLDLDLLNEPAAIAAENLVRERFEGSRPCSDPGRPRAQARDPVSHADAVQKADHAFCGTSRRRPEASREDRISGAMASNSSPMASIPTRSGIRLDRRRSDHESPTTICPRSWPPKPQQLQNDIAALLVRDFGYVVAGNHSAQNNGGTPAKRAKAARKNPKRDEAWARAALDAECAKIASAPTGHPQRRAQSRRLQHLPDRVGQSRAARRRRGAATTVCGGRGLRAGGRRWRRQRLANHHQRC